MVLFLKRKNKISVHPDTQITDFMLITTRIFSYCYTIYIALWWLEIASVETLWHQIPTGSPVYGSVKVIHFFLRGKLCTIHSYLRNNKNIRRLPCFVYCLPCTSGQA